MRRFTESDELTMPEWINYKTPSIQSLDLPIFVEKKLKVLVRREDQNHPNVSGNKWWKLKYNLLEAVQQNATVLTFGGAYSNHIYATASACDELGLKSIGVIRGEEIHPLNFTLSFAKEHGMRFHFIPRSDYRRKNDIDFIDELEQKFGRCFIIPEGGTNALAVKGCEELGKQILETDFDYLCLPVGTGGTIAGIIKAFEGKRKIIGIPVLKDGRFLINEIQNLLPSHFDNWELLLDYHQGGYAKTNSLLDDFILGLKKIGLPSEFVYSGKLLWAVADLAKKDFFKEGATVLILHTGGLRTELKQGY
jgi:1-aminocyclopropane-1-carboxylate deaminase